MLQSSHIWCSCCSGINNEDDDASAALSLLADLMESHGYPGKYRLVIGKDQSYFTQDGKLVVAVSGSQAARWGMEASVLLTKLLHNLACVLRKGEFLDAPGVHPAEAVGAEPSEALADHWDSSPRDSSPKAVQRMALGLRPRRLLPEIV